MERRSAPITALVRMPHHAPAGYQDSDAVARPITIEASAARRAIPGSMPVTQPGLQPGPHAFR
jgi:hypothetical protein